MQTTRLTGSYYTSQRIANYMVEWALRDKSDSLLEPSFGDGVFLDAAFDRFSALGNNTPTVIGVELQPTVFSKYADSAPLSFVGYCKDFMDHSEETAVSAVVGNPPYVSLRNLKEEDRTRAIDRTADYKIKMLSSGSLWMPFTIHASNMLVPNGRLAFVLPFEITYVKYAYPLWTYLGSNFGSLKVVRIHEDFFPDVDVETVLLFADQYGANTHCIDFEIYDSVDDLFADSISLKSKIEISDITHRKKPFAFSMLNEDQRNMKTNHYYSDLLRQYPAYMTKEQMYQVCHISKKTCLFLLQSGRVPCLDSGKKTRRFKIETANVIRYLADRELHPDRYKPPDGFYKRKRVKVKSRRKKRRKQGTDTPSPSVTGVDPCIMREYYRAELELYPDDVLTTRQISEFTGYSHSSVVRWCNKQYLQNFYIRHRFYVPKEYLLDFFTSRHFINISVKSELHKERNQQLIQYQAESCSAMVSTPQPSEKRTKNKVYTKNQGS